MSTHKSKSAEKPGNNSEAESAIKPSDFNNIAHESDLCVHPFVNKDSGARSSGPWRGFVL